MQCTTGYLALHYRTNNTPHLELLLQALVLGCGSRLELLHNLDLLQGRKGTQGIL